MPQTRISDFFPLAIRPSVAARMAHKHGDMAAETLELVRSLARTVESIKAATDQVQAKLTLLEERASRAEAAQESLLKRLDSVTEMLANLRPEAGDDARNDASVTPTRDDYCNYDYGSPY